MAQITTGTKLTISVRNEIGLVAIDMQSGEKIFKLLKKKLDEDLPIGLDFQRVEFYGATFFNAAIGQLYAYFSPQQIDSICFSNLSELGWKILNTVKIVNQRYYSDSKFANALNTAISYASQRF